MAGRRSFRRRIRRVRRRRSSRRLATRGFVNRAANRSETKCENVVFASGTVQPGTLYLERIANSLSKGDNMGQRQGRSIFVKHVNISGFIRNLNSTSGNKMFMRIALLRNRTLVTDYQTGLWKSEGITNDPINYDTAGNLLQINRPFARTNRAVVWQKRIQVPILRADSNNNAVKFVSWTIYLNKKITFVSTGNQPIPEYGLVWFFETEQGAATFTAPNQFHFNIRTYYKDN